MFENMDIARLKYILTMDCNFRCDYCFEGGKTNKFLDVDQAVAVGKQVLGEMTQEELTVLYFGGEPFLRFRDMKLITQVLALYALKMKKRIAFSAIINGTILTAEMAEHLSRYRYYLSVSCDGVAEAHNIHRGFLNGARTSFPMVARNINILNEATKDFCVSMVVTNQNVSYLSQSVAWLLELGIKNFAISPVLDQSQYTPDPILYERQLKEVADLAGNTSGRLTINPPLDKPWDDDNTTRRMYRSSQSVNIEFGPLGLNIIAEKSLAPQLDFSLDASAGGKSPASEEGRAAVINAEKAASLYYGAIKSQRENFK
ncbi:MAG: radical SAM protein [Negativicutes bacterium]|nr:radical SAM protein [Negativicutes bacterium]